MGIVRVLGLRVERVHGYGVGFRVLCACMGWGLRGFMGIV